MEIHSDINPYCYKIDYRVNVSQLIDDLNTIEIRLGWPEGLSRYTPEFFNSVRKMFGTNGPGDARNLMYVPGQTGLDRYRGVHAGGSISELRSAGLNESDFTELLEECKGLYIESVINDIRAYHGTLFCGRVQPIWVDAGRSYPLHKDDHVSHRYHIPLITNTECYWMFETDVGVQHKLHMPADGSVWYVDPYNIKHTVINNGTTPRLHLMLTSVS
jgi:hypothetical protein